MVCFCLWKGISDSFPFNPLSSESGSLKFDSMVTNKGSFKVIINIAIESNFNGPDPD